MLGDELGGLIGQLPRSLIFLTCGAGILWLALMVFFAVIRPARRRAREAASRVPAPAFVPAPAEVMMPSFASSQGDSMDLPDLDMLTSGHEPAKAMSASPLPPAARRLGSADVKLSDGSLVHATELLVVLRDPRDSRLIVQVGDTAYKSIEGTPARAALDALFAELGQPPAPAADSATPPAAESPRPAPAAMGVPPPPALGGMPGDLPKFAEMKDEIKSRGAFRPYKTEVVPVPELNIPAAIEAYLQYKKSFVSEYAHRSIHVHAAPGGGVRIEVDGKFYDAVGDVEDADVRTFLQLTIHEWQSRQ